MPELTGCRHCHALISLHASFRIPLAPIDWRHDRTGSVFCEGTTKRARPKES